MVDNGAIYGVGHIGHTIDVHSCSQAEMERVTGVINSMKDIIKMIAVRESLSAKISEFEELSSPRPRVMSSRAFHWQPCLPLSAVPSTVSRVFHCRLPA